MTRNSKQERWDGRRRARTLRAAASCTAGGARSRSWISRVRDKWGVDSIGYAEHSETNRNKKEEMIMMMAAMRDDSDLWAREEEEYEEEEEWA